LRIENTVDFCETVFPSLAAVLKLNGTLFCNATLFSTGKISI